MLPSSTPIRVIIADDHELLREGLSLVLGKDPRLVVEGLAANGEQLVALTGCLRPQVVLTDIVMPGMDGIEATRRIRELSPETGVVALSTFDSPSMVIDMLRAGACGYLLKNVDRREIIEAIVAASRQEEYFCRIISRRLAQYVLSNDAGTVQRDLFSERELVIIRCICQEMTTEEISRELCLGKRTIDGLRARILGKMEARGTAGLVLYALLHGLYRPADGQSLPGVLGRKMN
ncbi:MAG: response regulator transcription factor [Chitinophagaceae bacterium]|nr:MAG: response regulator transcription factor [Chitinophagaceae bacterium]